MVNQQCEIREKRLGAGVGVGVGRCKKEGKPKDKESLDAVGCDSYLQYRSLVGVAVVFAVPSPRGLLGKISGRRNALANHGSRPGRGPEPSSLSGPESLTLATGPCATGAEQRMHGAGTIPSSGKKFEGQLGGAMLIALSACLLLWPPAQALLNHNLQAEIPHSTRDNDQKLPDEADTSDCRSHGVHVRAAKERHSLPGWSENLRIRHSRSKRCVPRPSHHPCSRLPDWQLRKRRQVQVDRRCMFHAYR